jgi:hypothetical protein
MTPGASVRNIRDQLRRGGSTQHAKGVQWFFKEKIRSHGWRTADLRRFARVLVEACRFGMNLLGI